MNWVGVSEQPADDSEGRQGADSATGVAKRGGVGGGVTAGIGGDNTGRGDGEAKPGGVERGAMVRQ